MISAVNRGPGTANIRRVVYQVGWFKRLIKDRDKYETVEPFESKDHELPVKLDMGDRTEFTLPYESGCFLDLKPTRIGMTDIFGRTHWAPRRELREVAGRYEIAFGKCKR